MFKCLNDLPAGVVKLVDTQRSGRCGSNPMEVQFLSPAPKFEDTRIQDTNHKQITNHNNQTFNCLEFDFCDLFVSCFLSPCILIR